MHNLTYKPRTDPRGLIKRLQEFNNYEPRADRVYAMSELSYLGGIEAQRVDKQVALDLFGASVLYSYQYLFDDRYKSTRNPYDPQYRGVCDLYNSALESGLRIICTNKELKPETSKTIHTASGTWDVTCKLRGSQWRPEDIARFRVRLRLSNERAYKPLSCARIGRSFNCGPPQQRQQRRTHKARNTIPGI